MNSSQKTLTAVMALLLVVALGAAGYFYKQYISIKNDPQKFTQETVDKLLSEISTIMVLPEGETPTVATVAEPEKLKEQPFFAKAATGDKVLIYTNARKAILYRPSEKKIIEVAPVNLGNPTGQASQNGAAGSATTTQ